MKVIREARPKQLYRWDCTCGAELEFTLSELQQPSSPAAGYGIRCPQCAKLSSVLGSRLRPMPDLSVTIGIREA